MNSIRITRSESRFSPTRGSAYRGLLLGIVALTLGFQVGLPPTAAAAEEEARGHALLKAMPVKRGMSEQAIACIACHQAVQPGNHPGLEG